MTLSTGPGGLVTATAQMHPCELYAHTSPPFPVRTQWHHRFPQYLQERVYGDGKVPWQDPPTARNSAYMLWLCGLCHDGVHEAIGWMLRESREPNPMPGRKMLLEAAYAVHLYREAMDVKALGHLGRGAGNNGQGSSSDVG